MLSNLISCIIFTVTTGNIYYVKPYIISRLKHAAFKGYHTTNCLEGAIFHNILLTDIS